MSVGCVLREKFDGSSAPAEVARGVRWSPPPVCGLGVYWPPSLAVRIARPLGPGPCCRSPHVHSLRKWLFFCGAVWTRSPFSSGASLGVSRGGGSFLVPCVPLSASFSVLCHSPLRSSPSGEHGGAWGPVEGPSQAVSEAGGWGWRVPGPSRGPWRGSLAGDGAQDGRDPFPCLEIHVPPLVPT